MDRLRHYSAALGLLAGVIALGLPWLSFELSSGVRGNIAWGDVSAGSVSVTVAAGAAWALTLLVTPFWRRILGAAVASMSLTAIVLAFLSLNRVPDIVLSRAESESGVIGVFTPDDLVWSWTAAGLTLSGVSVLAFLVTGLALIVWPGASRHRDPYQRETSDPWEQLSRGGDPTER